MTGIHCYHFVSELDEGLHFEMTMMMIFLELITSNPSDRIYPIGFRITSRGFRLINNSKSLILILRVNCRFKTSLYMLGKEGFDKNPLIPFVSEVENTTL